MAFLPGHVFGTASQHTYATTTLLKTVSGVNLSAVSTARCDRYRDADSVSISIATHSTAQP